MKLDRNCGGSQRMKILLSIAWTALSSHYAQAQQSQPHYTVSDRGPSLVRTLTDTPGLNNQGDLAIWHAISANQMPGRILHHGQTIPIVGVKEFSLVYPADMNDRLTVVGTLQAPQDLRFTRAFLWANNKLEILPSLGGPYAAANAINAAGDVVGSAQTANGARHAVLWRRTQPRDLGLLAQGDYSSARDINDNDQIAGEANLVPNGKPRAFAWYAGSMRQLPILPGGTLCTAQAINARGDIAGSCDTAKGANHGVIWRDGAVEDLGTLGDEESPSTALDINQKGQVVGSSENDGKLRAFFWENGKMIDLNKTLTPGSGWVLLVASRINDRGEIVGRGYFRGSIHAFLLHPAD